MYAWTTVTFAQRTPTAGSYFIVNECKFSNDLPLTVWLPSSFGMVGHPIQEHNNTAQNVNSARRDL